eukprot:sb/3476297/
MYNTLDLGDIDTWCDPHTQVSAQPQKGLCLSNYRFDFSVNFEESSLGSSKDQWKQDIWELRGIKGSRAQGESIGDIGTWCRLCQCVGIALGGYVAKPPPPMRRFIFLKIIYNILLYYL